MNFRQKIGPKSGVVYCFVYDSGVQVAVLSRKRRISAVPFSVACSGNPAITLVDATVSSGDAELYPNPIATFKFLFGELPGSVRSSVLCYRIPANGSLNFVCCFTSTEANVSSQHFLRIR